VLFGNGEIFFSPGLAPQPVAVYQVFGTAVTLDQVITYGFLLAIVVVSYRQTIRAYPRGGGSYIVASDNLGPWPGMTAAAGLMRF